jgi:hypothetical protein
MKLQDAVNRFVGVIVAPALLSNQAQALAIFVASALTVTRSILTDLAVEARRHGFATTTKHALKRLDRWINNPRIKVSVAMKPIVERLIRKRKKKLIVSLDWVDIRSFKVLVAACNIKGRCVWLMWKSIPKSGLNLHMNQIEQDVLFELRQLVPAALKVVILADRGFHKSRMFLYCRKMRFDYVIRIKADYSVKAKRFKGLLCELPVVPGTRRFWGKVICGRKPEVTQNVVVYYQKNLPQKRDEPWFLATSLTGTPEQMVKLYGRRMEIEQSFRDKKNVNNGWGLRHMRVKRAEALDRLLLILSIAYMVLCGLGLYALKHLPPRMWCSNNRPGECGVFTIARRVLDLLQVPIEQLFEEIGLCSKSRAPKWG